MKDAIKDAILEMIAEKGGGISFVEMETIDGFCGDYTWSRSDTNLILWDGISEDGQRALRELLDENQICGSTCSPLVYMIDGKALALPIAKNARKAYKNPRWLPLVFNLATG